MADLSGKSLERYYLLERLGEGGMAVVYKALNHRLEREVAVKVIRVEKLTPEQLPRALKRFEREAKALGKLTHPNIVPVSDYGEFEGAPFLVMPFLSGGTLKQRLGKPIPWKDAVHIMAPIARALEYAHHEGVIHRDVKSSNILITGSGQPMLSDFGVAKVLSVEETVDLTGTGMGVGTPEYMAPEQWNGQTLPQSDQYSLGVVLYEMLTGRKPYTAETPAAILLKQATEALPRPRAYARDLPDKLERILLKALARDPKNRYTNMGAFSEALEDALGERTEVKRIRPVTVPQTNIHKIVEPAVAQPQKSPAKRTRLDWKAAGVVGAVLIVLTLISSRVYQKPSAIETSESPQISTNIPAIVASLKPAQTSPDTPATTPTRPAPEPTSTNIPITPTSELGMDSTMIGKDGMTLLYIPAGEFIMGRDGFGDNQLAHTIYLDAIWIDQTEVTNAMYALCVDGGVCKPPSSTQSYTRGSYFGNPEFSDFPVIHVPWDAARTYCTWADRRLPTEAEWEKAARGTDENFFVGTGGIVSNHGGQDTVKIGSYPQGASPYGALDMAGNVWEWVSDWYDPNYYQFSPSSNPQGPPSGQFRVMRGGYPGSMSNPVMLIPPTAVGMTQYARAVPSVFVAPVMHHKVRFIVEQLT